MLFSLRSFTDDDYQAMHDILHELSAHETITPEELRCKDQVHHPNGHFHRWVLEKDGIVLAIGEYDQEVHHFDPRIFLIDGMVRPAFQHQGLGNTLYTHLLTALQPFHPLWVRKRIRVDQVAGLHFLTQRGFQEERRLWVSRLDLASFPALPLVAYEEQLSTSHLTIKTTTDLSSDPERNQKLYHLVNELSEDVPSPEPRRRAPYEEYVQSHLTPPHRSPEGYVVACHGNNYIGLSELRRTEKADELTTGLTAVKRAYRRRGIASLLKQYSLASAKASGYQAIWTSNDVRNLPMLTLNDRLGFVKQDLWIDLGKRFSEG